MWAKDDGETGADDHRQTFGPACGRKPDRGSARLLCKVAPKKYPSYGRPSNISPDLNQPFVRS